MRHAQPAQDDLARGHVDDHAAIGLSLPPAADHVRLAQGGDEPRPAAFHGQPVQVTPVLRNDFRDERRPPSRNEAVFATRAAQAGEPRVHQPEMIDAEGHVMNVQIARVVRDPRQVERVVPARLPFEELVSQQRGIGQLDDLMAGRQEHPRAVEVQAHGLGEVAEQQGHLPAVPADHPDLARLVGRQHDRAPSLAQPGREGLRDVAPDRARTPPPGEEAPWGCP